MNLIFAADQRWGIGKKGGLLTHLPKDLGRFQRLTTGNIVLMGRKTLESLPGGKPLKNRENWILTRNKSYKPEGVLVFHSIDEVLSYIEKEHIDDSRVFVSGGAAVYKTFLPLVDVAYITKLKRDFHADVFVDNVDDIPNLSLDWVSETFIKDDLEYEFTTYKKCQ